MTHPAPAAAAPGRDPALDHFDAWYALQRRRGAPAEADPLTVNAYLSALDQGRLLERTGLHTPGFAPRAPDGETVNPFQEACFKGERSKDRDTRLYWANAARLYLLLIEPRSPREYEAIRQTHLRQLGDLARRVQHQRVELAHLRRRQARLVDLPADVNGYAVAGPLLELDVLLANLVEAAYAAGTGSESDAPGAAMAQIAQDEAGAAECKAIQRWARRLCGIEVQHG